MLVTSPLLIGVFLLLIAIVVAWTIFVPDEEEMSLMGRKGGEAEKKDPIASGYSFEDKFE